MKTEQYKKDKLKFKSVIGIETDKEIRELVGINQRTLDRIFKGESSQKNVLKLTSYFGIKLSVFDTLMESSSFDLKQVTLPTPVKPKKAKRSVKTDAPSPFKVTEIMTDWFLDQNLTVDIQMQTRKFIDYHRSKGNKFVDWVAAWRNWMRKAQEYFNKEITNPVTNNKKDIQNSLSNINDVSWAKQDTKQEIKAALGNIHDFNW